MSAYGRIGNIDAHPCIAGLLTTIFKPCHHTAHLVRSELVCALAGRAATILWESIRATYADKTDFVCNKAMELLHLFQQFDGSHYKTLETDIHLLLEQISSEDLNIRDLTAMCLVMGIKFAGRNNATWHDAHLAIIKLKPTSWEKIEGQPDRLGTVSKKAQQAEGG